MICNKQFIYHTLYRKSIKYYHGHVICNIGVQGSKIEIA